MLPSPTVPRAEARRTRATRTADGTRRADAGTSKLSTGGKGTSSTVTDAGTVDGAPTTCHADPNACAGKCGPVIDPCTAAELDCGGCAAGLACDIDAHRCTEPLTTCRDLGAACDKIRNTCGARLDCGDCPAMQECDPNTNACVACSNPTCLELGFECSAAWLGCGPRTALTDCGPSPSGFTGNESYSATSSTR